MTAATTGPSIENESPAIMMSDSKRYFGLGETMMTGASLSGEITS